MSIFPKSQGSTIAKAITKDFVQPDGDEDTWSETTVKNYEANAKVTFDKI